MGGAFDDTTVANAHEHKLRMAAWRVAVTRGDGMTIDGMGEGNRKIVVMCDA